MAALFAYGLLAFISLVLGIVFMIVSLFVGHIIIFDSILLAIGSGAACYQLLHFHPALALLVGLGVFFLLIFLQGATKAGFWIIGGIMSVLWALLFTAIVYSSTGKDMVWSYVTFGLSIVIMILLHLHSRKKDMER